MQVRFNGQGYVHDPKLQREVFDEIGRKIGVKVWQDWYQSSQEEIHNYGGRAITKY